MAKGINIKEIIKEGTVKQKALLIIQNNYESTTLDGGFLKDSEIRSIINSIKPHEANLFNRYLSIANLYDINRFRILGLSESLKKIVANIAGLCNIWELSEQFTEYNNTLLELLQKKENSSKTKRGTEYKDLIKCIDQHSKSWSKYARLKKGEDGEYKLDISLLKGMITNHVNNYTATLAIGKALLIASDELVQKYNAESCIPSDVKDMLESLKNPHYILADLYRRDIYLQLLRERGEEDREVQYREKYAILPAWEEIEPRGLDNAREAFSL